MADFRNIIPNTDDLQQDPESSKDDICIESLIKNKEVMFSKCIRSDIISKRARYVENSSLIDDSLVSNFDEVLISFYA